MNIYLRFAQRLRVANKGVGEISDSDFNKSAINDCMKNYWRNIHKQANMRLDPERYEKTLDVGRHRSRRQAVKFLSSLVIIRW